MKGIEYLRNIYIAVNLSIRPKIRASGLEQLELCRVLGYNPEKVLVKEAFMEPHRANQGTVVAEKHEIETLRTPVKKMCRNELLNNGT